MLKATTILLSSLISLAIYAQEEQWDPKTLKLARNAENISYLTQVEKDVVYYSNLARLNPPLFGKTFLMDYIENNNIELSKWTKACKLALRKTKPMKPLMPKEDLYREAKKHASDMGKTGKYGHKTSKGKSCNNRLKHLRTSYTQLYENCNYGFADGLSIVCDFLIDRDVPDAGHRNTILNPTLLYIGTSVQPHKEYQVNCVQDFGS